MQPRRPPPPEAPLPPPFLARRHHHCLGVGGRRRRWRHPPPPLGWAFPPSFPLGANRLPCIITRGRLWRTSLNLLELPMQEDARGIKLMHAESSKEKRLSGRAAEVDVLGGGHHVRPSSNSAGADAEAGAAAASMIAGLPRSRLLLCAAAVPTNLGSC